MLHRTVFVLFMSMLFGAMAALAMSVESLHTTGQNSQHAHDMDRSTPTSSPIMKTKSKPVMPAHRLQPDRLPSTTYPAR